MLDIILELFALFGEPLVELFPDVFANMFSGLFSIGDRIGTEMLSVVSRLPAAADVLLAKGGR